MAGPRYVHGQRAVGGDEHVFAAHGLAARCAHAQRMPVVDDLVLRAMQQAVHVIDDLIMITHDAREHAPVRVIGAGRETPFAGEHNAAVREHTAALRVSDTRRYTCITVGTPHSVSYTHLRAH